MSFFSLVNIMFISVLLPCIFFFHPFVLFLILLFYLFIFIKLVGDDLCTINVSRSFGFWLFLLSEIIVFGSLLVSCLWFQSIFSVSLAYAYFIPLIETVLLVGSSFFISAYHCLLGSRSGFLYLVMAIFSAFIFMFLAGYEILSSVVSSLYTSHVACCYLAVGLHFSHVFLGSILLLCLLLFSLSSFIRRNSDMFIIYWHFVDYIWLFVFTIVYLAV